MQRYKIFLTLCIFSFSSILFYNCAGTKQDSDDSFENQDSQQQELDDIEALLGITHEEPKEQPAKRSSNEQLNLLETDEMVGQQNNSMASAALAQQTQDENTEQENYKKEVSKLKNQIRKKNNEIANLENQVAFQNTEIERLSAAPKSRSFSTPVGDVSSEEYQARYDEGRAAFEGRNYKAAIEYFETLLASSSTHALADNAQFWVGESHYALRQYDSAIIDFEKVLTFARANKKPDAQFKLGMCYLMKGDRTKAIEEFNRLQSDYPESEYNAKAEKLLAKY